MRQLSDGLLFDGHVGRVRIIDLQRFEQDGRHPVPYQIGLNQHAPSEESTVLIGPDQQLEWRDPREQARRCVPVVQDNALPLQQEHCPDEMLAEPSDRVQAWVHQQGSPLRQATPGQLAHRANGVYFPWKAPGKSARVGESPGGCNQESL